MGTPSLGAAMVPAMGVLFALALALLFCLPGHAWGATAHGVDDANAAGASTGSLAVVEVAGNRDETVFVTVTDGGRIIAKNLAYTLGEDAEQLDQGAESWHGIIRLDIDGLDTAKLENGMYSIQVFDDRAGKNSLYTGTIYGVYAQVGSADKQLIGTRTVSDGEMARSFDAPPVISLDGVEYATDGNPVNDGPAYLYKYTKADAPSMGSVRYVFSDGATNQEIRVDEQEVAVGSSVSMPIESIVEDDAGNRYRSIFSQDDVTLSNPGMLSFTIYCAKLMRDDSNDYIAAITMSAENGSVLARDQVEVKGSYTYTAPSAIYRTETVDGVETVVTYERVGAGVVDLADADVRAAGGATVAYQRQDPESAQVKVTFNLIDGTKEPGDSGRLLGTKTAVASQNDPTVQPDARFTAGGSSYEIAGEPASYAYTYRSGAVPVVDVYYVPAGYHAEGSYTVTVRYVNYANNQVVGTQEFVSSPDEASAVAIEAPARHQADGATYIRLDGQENLRHSYYSGVRTYTVYYRDSRDTLSAGVSRVRVVYDDTSSRTTGTQSTGSASTGAGASASSSSSATGTAATDTRLNQDSTYNTIGGNSGNGALTNERGVDSTTERIADEETPLSSPDAAQEHAEDNAPAGGLPVPAIVGVALALIAAIVALAMRRRANDASSDNDAAVL